MTEPTTPPSLENEVAELRAELAELRSRMEGTRPASAPAPTSDPAPALTVLEGSDARTDRRGMLKKAGAIAAGAVAGGAALSAMQASPAAAANGGNMIIGAVNTETNPGGNTELRQSGTPTPTWSSFMVQDNTIGLDFFGSMIGAIATTDQIHGVYGRNDSGGFGVVARGNGPTASGLLATVGATGKANIRINANGPVPQSRNANGAFAQGDLIDDLNGDLWLCVNGGASGAAATWRKLAGPATAGSLQLLAGPARIYDSRNAGPNHGIFNNVTRSIDATQLDGGGASGVPVGATAVAVNLAATNTNSGGFAALFNNAIAWPGNASVNWGSANMTISNFTITALSATALFKCKVAGVADIIIDVIGFYR